VRFRHAAATLFVLGFVVPAWALTLGPPRGTAWIGKPLDVAIPLRLDAAEAGDSLCPSVEVVQGEAAMDPGRVTVSLEPGSQPGAPLLRVRTARPVEEPILTMTVRAGCAATSTRSYVLLADPPPVEAAPPVVPAAAARPAGEAPSAAAPARPPVRASRVQRAPEGGGGAQASAPRPRRAAAAVASGSTRSAARPAAAPKPRPAPAASAAAEAPSGGGRLQVDALEPLAPRPAAAAQVAPAAAAGVAGASAAASGAAPAPTGDAGVAAAPPSSPPSEAAVREAERTVMLEKALAELREQTARNEQTLLELRRELAAARESRYSNPLVYILAGLLALALLAIAMLWRLTRRDQEPIWTEARAAAGRPARRSRFAATGDDPDTLPGPDAGEAAEAQEPGPPPGMQALGAAGAAAMAADEDDDAADADVQARHAAGEDFHATMPGQLPTSRSVNTEELFDVQQQAEFFLSLGQHEQAIEALSEYVAMHPDTSALAYLELLRIFHSLGRMLDYERVRRQCQQALNVRVPAFDEFQEQGRPLDHYDEVLRRIEEHWPGPESLPVIEELLMRKPGEEGAAPFDLAAYRELLMLYAMAQEPPAQADAPRVSVYETLTRHHQRESTLPMALSTQPAPLDDPLSQRDTLLFERPRDFSPTRPPHPLTATLDFDLDELQAPSVETLPQALRARDAAADSPSADIDLFDPRVESGIEPGVTRRR